VIDVENFILISLETSECIHLKVQRRVIVSDSRPILIAVLYAWLVG